MKTSEYMTATINRLPAGYVSYDGFVTEVNNNEDIIKALNRIATSDKIVNTTKWNIVQKSINFNK